MIEENSFLGFLSKHKEKILTAVVILAVYKMGYRSGYNKSVDAVNQAFDRLSKTIKITQL